MPAVPHNQNQSGKSWKRDETENKLTFRKLAVNMTHSNRGPTARKNSSKCGRLHTYICESAIEWFKNEITTKDENSMEIW